jgi:hypothetical protein
MAKLTLKQLESLIENNLLEEDKLKEFLKEGYQSKDVEDYFLEKLKENKELNEDDGDREETGRFEY